MFRFASFSSAAPCGILALALLGLLGGCGSQHDPAHSNAVLISDPSSSAQSSVANDGLVGGKLIALQTGQAAAQRKIIYNAKVSVETVDINQFSQQLTSQLAVLGGFVADFSEQRYAGNRRTATWTLRIDSQQFSALLDWFDGESNVTHKEVSSQDVTEDFVDLTARLDNKRNTERRLVEILENRPGKLEEVLSVEREIDRVREEAERIEGRLRLLSERSALSTVTLTANTRIDYQPPLQATFGTRISEAWWQSLNELQTAAERLAVGVVSLAPWLPILAVLFAVVYGCARFLWRKLGQLAGNEPPVLSGGPTNSKAPLAT